MLFIFNISLSRSQSFSLNGTVVDAVTHEPVAHAIIEILELGQIKSTDTEGRFQFKQLSSGRYTLSVHHVAYAYDEQSFVLPQNQNDSIVIILHPALFKSDAVRYSKFTHVVSDEQCTLSCRYRNE